MGVYDELARRAEHGGLSVKPGTVRRGPEAAEAAGAALMEATGATTVQEATRVAVGRPPLGKEGKSPVVRARVPQALKDQLHQIAQDQHRKESEIVREALIAYLRSEDEARTAMSQ
ncbi:ribbon-helix-helix domain-containing protein [Kocuria rosea]|uniref:ribbon-helix-helix domain-containing protein n=1 Tax=Kocuria rosea TaxID=1275 RepID=UPI00203BFAE1|nr:ribbon-helix-helix domain-containing protein [Kocuria rosea]